ncbi:MAG: GntR family transcriptional regulator [Planctomycetes bacterium]|nr:GntR family transcriptional regulator [Planctomycetota bacterium]
MRERAYRQLRHLLILQQIPVGKRLREAEWTARLKVNRSALREAFARLEAQGLIQAGPKTGYMVPSLDHKTMGDILAVRMMLEVGAIEIVCESGLNTPAHLHAAIEACQEFENALTDQNVLRIVEADWKFHDALIAASKNKRLKSVYHHAPLPLLLPDETSGPAWNATIRQTATEHRALLDTILAGNATKAVSLLRSHLLDRWTKLMERRKAR